MTAKVVAVGPETVPPLDVVMHTPSGPVISTTSPVGRSLMGKQEGDEVVVRTPAGARNFEIRQLRTLHDELEP